MLTPVHAQKIKESLCISMGTRRLTSHQTLLQQVCIERQQESEML